jgi:hypothetical protein
MILVTDWELEGVDVFASRCTVEETWARVVLLATLLAFQFPYWTLALSRALWGYFRVYVVFSLVRARSAASPWAVWPTSATA